MIYSSVRWMSHDAASVVRTKGRSLSGMSLGELVKSMGWKETVSS